MKHLRLPRSLSTAAVIFFLAAAASSASGQLLEFRFNDSGTTTANAGSSTDTGAFLDGPTATPTAVDLHGASGSGVSGLAGDLAFDNTGTTWQTSGSSRLKVEASTALNGLTSFTLSGWYKTSETTGWAAARLFSKNTTGNALELYFSTGSKAGGAGLNLALATPGQTTSTSVSSGLSADLGLADQWVFFAVSYDGTLTEDNIRFYYGSTTTEVTLLTVGTLNAGTLAASPFDLNIGNNVSNRPWDGYLDNIRLFGATSGGGGALGMAQLESWRQVDVIPEASTALLLMTGLTMLMARHHFRGRRNEAA
ncbi:MAG TPA: LamG-like jellyroll fold domain-containing protein [Chthoniobacteraceae bacterium]|nr:LamG-like jellyroll fold domain-containing protein [Chthoniobacteraceae bacterium]